MPLTKADKDGYLELRKIWAKDPVLYARTRLGFTPTWQQAKILEAVAPAGSKVSVRSGHGIGKSASISAAGWWFLECFDFSKMPCTAPTKNQLEQVLWSELSKWRRKSEELAKQQGLPEELWLTNLFSFSATMIAEVGSPKEWFAVARTSRKENPAALAGFHASDVTIAEDGRSVLEAGDGGNIMFVIEEASGVPDEIFEVAEGALSSHGARLLMAGNPTKNSGYFAGSHKKDRASYTALHFTCADSPLVDPDYRAGLVRKFGENSNIVRVRADGEFPKQEDDVLISLEMVELALQRGAGVGIGKRRLGVDVARFGSDRTTFIGREGNQLIHAEIHSKMDAMEVCGHIVRCIETVGFDEICVDAAGLGAGVPDRLRELKREGKLEGVAIIDVVASRRAPKRAKGSDVQPFILRDHMWYETAQWLKLEEPSFAGIDKATAEDLGGELASIKYSFDSDGRLHVEKKADMKKRLGGMSPDLGDALIHTFTDSMVMLIAPGSIHRPEGVSPWFGATATPTGPLGTGFSF